MAAPDKLLIIEPQCCGFEHVPVNSALLAVLRKAFPAATLIFAAEEEHQQLVSGLCRKNGVEIRPIPFRPPARNLSHLKRYPAEKRCFREAITVARNEKCRGIIFASLTDTGFHIQKKFAQDHPEFVFVNFLHGMLQSLRESPPWKPWKRIFWFPDLLKAPLPANIRFFVFGDSIRGQALRLAPAFGGQLFSLDLPLFFQTPRAESCVPPLRLGTIGIGGRSKGTHLLFELARRFTGQINAGLVQFIGIGPIFDKRLTVVPPEVEIPSPRDPLPLEEYERLIRSLDFALFLYDRNAYTLTASGAFMDAIAFARPVIGLDNPFFAHYFEKFGDIGFLCRDLEEVATVIEGLIRGGAEERQQEFVRNILSGRESISLERLGESLHSALDGLF